MSETCEGDVGPQSSRIIPRPASFAWLDPRSPRRMRSPRPLGDSWSSAVGRERVEKVTLARNVSRPPVWGCRPLHPYFSAPLTGNAGRGGFFGANGGRPSPPYPSLRRRGVWGTPPDPRYWAAAPFTPASQRL